MRLVEREAPIQELQELLDQAASGEGRVVLIRGEAGIGKTSLVRSFVEAVAERAHILWGGCDDLSTARPLNPFWDMAEADEAIAGALTARDRDALFRSVVDRMSRALRPTVMVVEDLQWVDEATLDLIRYVGRRIQRTHGLLVLTYRDGEVDRDHPLRRVLGELDHGTVSRLALQPLSRAAVAQLLGDGGDVDEVVAVTGGNPFFVTELATHRGAGIPASISDSVTGRVGRLTPEARTLVEYLSVMPGGAEVRIVSHLVGAYRPALDEGTRAGLLALEQGRIGFRHELVRTSVARMLHELDRRRLNLEVLVTLEADGADVALCAHHAREAEDPGAVLRLLPLAAAQAAELGSHTEAVDHLRAVEPYAARWSPGELADYYDFRAREELLMEEPAARDFAAKAVSLRRALGEPGPLGMSLLTASEVESQPRGDLAQAYATEAIALLGEVGPESQAMAHAMLSRHQMLAGDYDKSIESAREALRLNGDAASRVMVYALANLGSSLAASRYPEGVAELSRSFLMAGELGLAGDQARAANNLFVAHMSHRELSEARRWVDAGLAALDEVEMPGPTQKLLSCAGWVAEASGEWDRGERLAAGHIESSDPGSGIVVGSIITLAQIHIRRGDPDAGLLADRAWEAAETFTDLQVRGEAGGLLAEHGWVSGDLSEPRVEMLVDLLDRLVAAGLMWEGGDLAQWLRLGGWIETVPEPLPAPYNQLAGGEWSAAADFWEEHGFPYERAVALSRGDVEGRLDGLRLLDGLGAGPLATTVRRRLQEEGVKGVPRGPYRARKASLLDLTPRQTEILSLLEQDLSNNQIADQLFLSVRTVEQHVSAILSRLGAADRFEAVERARRALAVT
jgi:DNA-binding CsgD family transcriptional regulator